MTSGPQPPNSPSGTERGIDWEQTLAQHAGWLRAVIANRLGSRGLQHRNDEVDEVMQEVALAAIKSEKSPSSPLGSVHPDKVGAWLYQVAVRQTLMFRRTAGRRRKLVDRVGEQVVAEAAADDTSAIHSGSDPLVWLLATERAEQIRAAIDNLHRRDREMLILKYEHGWTYQQLVEQMGISRSAVEARLHRARKRLRSELVRRQLVEQE